MFDLTESELEEHKRVCVDRPSAWNVEVFGSVRKAKCALHGVPESIDLSELERMDNPAWTDR